MVTFRNIFYILIAFFISFFLFVIVSIRSIYPDLPAMDVLTKYSPKIPLQIFSSEGYLIGEFGTEKREFVKISQVPNKLVESIIAAEDERFYEHGGIDLRGIVRAFFVNLSSGTLKQGASTITQQVARNFFLSNEKTISRKFTEILLAIKIEKNLSKNQIMELYINQIYLGERNYGFGAASKYYFNKEINEINLSEAAMLAGLPKAPSKYNPVANFNKAKLRQKYVLQRLLHLDYVTKEEFSNAFNRELNVTARRMNINKKTDYFVEMVRKNVYESFQKKTYQSGLKVYTTLSISHQNAAFKALREGIFDYEHKKGSSKPIEVIENDVLNDPIKLKKVFDKHKTFFNLIPAVLTKIENRKFVFLNKFNKEILVQESGFKNLKFDKEKDIYSENAIPLGSLFYLRQNSKDIWEITTLPAVEGAFVSIDTYTGGIKSLVGGFDFNKNKFNHVTQALRQPGSSFKPFIYAAALSKGLTPATLINDAPLIISTKDTGFIQWDPQNYDQKFNNFMSMRNALTLSKNLVSIRILQNITPSFAKSYIKKFGFDPKKHPPYLTLALGAGTVSPLKLASAYAIFANGGYKIHPHFIRKIEDANGNILAKVNFPKKNYSSTPILDPRVAFIMSNMMQDVIKRGTGKKALQIGRTDLSGKTGTTNDQIDAWFAGYQRRLVAVSWVGYSKPKTLGKYATGAAVALPIWISYMKEVLSDYEEELHIVPDGVIPIAINSKNRFLHSNSEKKIIEYFLDEYTPSEAKPNINIFDEEIF